MSKYCSTITLNHTVAQKNSDCVEFINCIIQRDSFHEGVEKCADYQSICFGEAKAINLDCVAKKQDPIPPSCDMGIGLDNGNFLLVELKLNASTVPKNLKIEDIKSKLCVSKDHISTIDHSLIIYCNRQRQKNYLLSRHGKTKKGKIEALGFKFMTLQTFKDTYF